MNDLETRLTEALAARADLVRPESLRDEPLPARVVPLWRRTPVVLAAAACLAVIATSTAVLATRDDGDRPQPTDPSPTIELPQDIGRDWDRVKASAPAELDLDGDGTLEKVRFLGEPTKGFDGRVRLQTTLSSDGSEVFGIVDVGTTIGVTALEPIDADADGDQELVLLDDHDPWQVLPVVLDLRDGVLVEAVPIEPDLLFMGQVTAAQGGEFYDYVRTGEFWIEDGTLLSARSRRAFAAGNMTLFVQEEYTMDAWVWRLRDDGVLVPESAPTPCVTKVPEGRRPCAEGEQDMLPLLAPVATDSIGLGESFSFSDGYPFEASVEESTTEGVATELVVAGDDGRTLRWPMVLRSEARVLTTAPGINWDGAAVVLTSGDGDQPEDLIVVAQSKDQMIPLGELGSPMLGSGTMPDGRAVRSWLTVNGGLFTAVAETTDESGPWQLYTWAGVERRLIASFPLDTLCFDDISDPATGHRC